MTDRNVLFGLNADLSRDVLEMLNIVDLVRLDSAVCSHSYRKILTTVMKTMITLSPTVTDDRDPAKDLCLIKWLYVREYKIKYLDLSEKRTISLCMSIAPDIWRILDKNSEVAMKVHSLEFFALEDESEYRLLFESCLDSFPVIINTLRINFHGRFDPRVADMFADFSRANNRAASIITGDSECMLTFLQHTRLAPFVEKIWCFYVDSPSFANNQYNFTHSYNNVDEIVWMNDHSRCPNVTCLQLTGPSIQLLSQVTALTKLESLAVTGNVYDGYLSVDFRAIITPTNCSFRYSLTGLSIKGIRCENSCYIRSITQLCNLTNLQITNCSFNEEDLIFVLRQFSAGGGSLILHNMMNLTSVFYGVLFGELVFRNLSVRGCSIKMTSSSLENELLIAFPVNRGVVPTINDNLQQEQRQHQAVTSLSLDLCFLPLENDHGGTMTNSICEMLTTGRYRFLTHLTVEMLNPRPVHIAAIQLGCPILEELHITAYTRREYHEYMMEIEVTFESFPQSWQHIRILEIKNILITRACLEDMAGCSEKLRQLNIGDYQSLLAPPDPVGLVMLQASLRARYPRLKIQYLEEEEMLIY